MMLQELVNFQTVNPAQLQTIAKLEVYQQSQVHALTGISAQLDQYSQPGLTIKLAPRIHIASVESKVLAQPVNSTASEDLG